MYITLSRVAWEFGRFEGVWALTRHHNTLNSANHDNERRSGLMLWIASGKSSYSFTPFVPKSLTRITVLLFIEKHKCLRQTLTNATAVIVILIYFICLGWFAIVWSVFYGLVICRLQKWINSQICQEGLLLTNHTPYSFLNYNPKVLKSIFKALGIKPQFWLTCN